MDYTCERGAKRNFEVWREQKEEITDEQHLDNLEAMEAEAAGEKETDTMQDLEERTREAKNEMAIADALDDIRTTNARREARAKEGEEVGVQEMIDWEKQRQEQEDEEAAKLAFQSATGDRIKRLVEEDTGQSNGSDSVNWQNGNRTPAEAPSFAFKKAVKPKKDFGAALGVKQGAGGAAKNPIAPVAIAKPVPQSATAKNKPALLAGYDSDSD